MKKQVVVEKSGAVSVSAIAAVLWGLFVLSRSFSTSVFQFTYLEAFFNVIFSGAVFRADLGKHPLQACAIWFVFLRLGSILAGRLRLDGLTRIESFLISTGLGAGTVSLALLALGIGGLWHPKLLLEIFYIGFALSAASIFPKMYRRRLGVDKREIPIIAGLLSSQEHLGILQGIALLLILLAVVISVLATAGPAIYYDSLVYHLALPKLYLLKGRIVPTPANMYSGIPLGMEMLYGLTLALGNENLACLLYCSFGILTMAAVWALLRRLVSNNAGILAALLFYLTPAVLCSGWWCGSDLAGAFYLSLAFLVIVLKLQAKDDPSLGGLITAGLLLGYALSIKYTLVPMLAVFALVYCWLRQRADKELALRETACMSAVAAAVFAPWLIKNIFFYGNPLYPFLSNSMGWASPGDWRGFLVDAHAQNFAQTFGSVAGWKKFLLRPWNFSVGTPSISDYMGLAFLIFIPWGLSRRWGLLKRSDEIPVTLTAVVAMSVAGYLVWALSGGLVRFMIPSMPFIACLAALAIVREPAPAWLRKAGWGVAIWVSLVNLMAAFSTGIDGSTGLWTQLVGKASSSAYLEASHTNYPAPYYAAMEYINHNLPPDAKVLFLGEPRTYYCERDSVSATIFDRNPFWEAARGARSAEDLYERVKKLGVTHIFANAIAGYSYAGRPTVMPEDVVEGKIFGEFWNRYLEKVFEDRQKTPNGATHGWLIVYRVLDKPAETSSIPVENPLRTVLENALRKTRA